MRFTVFTPTYNRAYIIENLYHSLQRQSFTDFEWLVIDDGSTDNTEALFKNILNNKDSFDIRYIKTANGGKHRAINKAVQLAHGDLFFIVDSDDYLTDDSLNIIDNIEKTIPTKEKNKFAGVCGLKELLGASQSPTTFEGEFLDITSLDRQKYNISGDKAEVYYTNILKKFPFPEYPDEYFVTECVVWNKIAFEGFLLRFFNQVIMICEYRSDGLTAKGQDLFIKNPVGWGLYIQQQVIFNGICGLEKWNMYLNYFYALKNKIRFSSIAKNLNFKPLVFFLRIFFLRLFYHFYDSGGK